MKIVIYILLLLIFSPRLFGQEWRDTLLEARKSYTQQNYEKSYKLYRSARKLAPKEIDLSDEVAQSAYKAGKYEQAEKIYGQSSSIKGSSGQKGGIHRQIGNAQMKQQKYSEAIESYKESLRNNPKDEYARYNLAEAMRKLKKEQQKQDKQDQKDRKNPQNQPPKQDKQDPQDPKQQDQPQKKQDQPGKENSEKQESQPQNSSQKQQQNAEQNKSSQKKTKLSDKKTERMLDDLMKMEMETKKKFEGVKSTGNVKKSGKDW